MLSFSCSQWLLDKTLLINFFPGPVLLSHSTNGTSWDHSPNKCLVLESVFLSLLLEQAKLRQSVLSNSYYITFLKYMISGIPVLDILKLISGCRWYLSDPSINKIPSLPVLVGVRKRNRTNRIDRDYKKLAHVAMEVEKSQDLQSTSWRPRRADGTVPFWVWRPQNQQSWWWKFYSESQQAWDRRVKVSVQVWRQERPISQLEAVRQEEFPLT